MPTEREKMLAGDLYSAADPDLAQARGRARDLLHMLNASRDEEKLLRQQIFQQLFAAIGKDVWIEPPFYCDYGSNITLGSRVFFNFNCVVLDPAVVIIGSDVLFGPNVQIYTATHPVDHRERRTWLELAKPVTIGSDAWIGGGAIICPGIQVGSRSVIGAGSVVTRDVPDGVFAAGNPCRVVKELKV